MKIAEFKKINEAIAAFYVALNESARVVDNMIQVDVPNWVYWLIARFYFSTQSVTVSLFADCDKPQRWDGEFHSFCAPYGLLVINPHGDNTKIHFRSFHHATCFHYFMVETYESLLGLRVYKKISLNEWMCGYDRDRLPAKNVAIKEDDE